MLRRPADREALLDRAQRARRVARGAQRAARDLRDDEARRPGRRWSADEPARTRGDGRPSVDDPHGQARDRRISRRLSAGGARPASAPSASSSSSAPGPAIIMCDWPSSPIIWFSDAVEGGLGRRAQRERLVLGAHGVPVDAAQRLVVVLVAHRPPGGVQDRPPHGRARVGACSRAWRARRPANGGGWTGWGGCAARRLGGRGRRGRRRGRRSRSATSADGERQRPSPAWPSVDASARPAAAPARAAAAVPAKPVTSPHANTPGDRRSRADRRPRRRTRRARRRSTTRAPCWRGSSDAGAGSAATATRSPATASRVLRRPRRAARGTSTPRSRLPPTRGHDRLAREVDPLDLDAGRRQRLAPAAPRSAPRPG